MNKKTTTKNKNSRRKSTGKKTTATNARKSTSRNSRSKTTKKETAAKNKTTVAKTTTRRPRKTVTKKTVKTGQRRTRTSEANDDQTKIKLVVKKPSGRKRVTKKEAVVTETSTANKSNNKNTSTSGIAVNGVQKVTPPENLVTINQNVAILIDGNNIEKSIHSLLNRRSAMLDFDNIIPKLLQKRGLNRLIYFREGLHISSKLADRLHKKYFGTVVPCHKSADIPLSITATQLADKVDTIIILSGDSDYVDLVRHLRSRGVRVEIAAIKQTTAKILIDEADFFTEITKEDCYIL